MMTKTGMLVVTNPNRFIRLMPRIQKEIKKTLYVQFYPEKRLRWPEIKTIPQKQLKSPSFSSTVLDFYSNSVLFRHLDVRVLLGALKDPGLLKINTKNPVEVVYFDHILNNDEMQGFLSNCVGNRTSNCEVIVLKPNGDEYLENQTDEKIDDCEMYNSVVLGGTFDRLHAGHKILLSEAVLRCRKKVTVGVTNTEMLKSKKLWELIEPCNIRIDKVREFLEEVDPSLEYDIVPIGDMYGPTKDDPTFEMLVVSCETIGGSSKVNELRKKNGLRPLAVRSVGLLPDVKMEEEEEDKISSSNERLRALGARLKQPKGLKLRGEDKPYVVGLTGGIASGKSSVSQRLREVGAGVVNCDHVAHNVYKKGNPGHDLILSLFGSTVLDPRTGEVDRKALGEIVFKDKEQLDRLNGVLWPAILKSTKEMVLQLYEKGHKVVVIEAAVLIQAGWGKECDEVWTCIVPPEEALKRLQDRNQMHEEDAKARISSQPSNLEYVLNSDVVFCTLWRPEYTKKQVDRAWHEIMKTLP